MLHKKISHVCFLTLPAYFKYLSSVVVVHSFLHQNANPPACSCQDHIKHRSVGALVGSVMVHNMQVCCGLESSLGFSLFLYLMPKKTLKSQIRFLVKYLLYLSKAGTWMYKSGQLNTPLFYLDIIYNQQ